MPNFPNSFDTPKSLFIVANNLRTQLSAPINASELTIPVVTTSGFPDLGYLTLLAGTDITQAEAIFYTSTTATEFNATIRGADGTPANSYNAGTNVDFTIQAAHHSALRDAVIELEHFVGVSGSENFLRVDDAGNVLVSGILNANTGVFSDLLTISGSPVATGTGIGLLVSGTNFLAGEIEFQATGDIELHTSDQVITWSGFGVRKTGDLMSGNLNMQGNNIFDAGVVVVQATAPTVVTSGLLWLDTTPASGTVFIQPSTKTRGASWIRAGAPIEVPVNNVPVLIPQLSVIQRANIVTLGGTGICEVDIWSAPADSFPPTVTNSITGGNNLVISGAETLINADISTWSTTVSGNNVLMFHLNSSTVFTGIFVTLEMEEV